MQKRFETRIQIRPSDIDLHNHVHYAKYLEYVIFARSEQMEKDYSYPIEKFFRQGLSWVVKTMQFNFKRPAGFKDQLSVITWIIDMYDSDCQVGFEIVKAGEKIADGSITFSLVSFKTGSPVQIPLEIKTYFLGFREPIN